VVKQHFREYEVEEGGVKEEGTVELTQQEKWVALETDDQVKLVRREPKTTQRLFGVHE
jgi:hypothetical protein